MNVTLSHVTATWIALCLLTLSGCAEPQETNTGPQETNTGTGTTSSETGSKMTPPVAPGLKAESKPTKPATANADDVKAARLIIDGLGARAKYVPTSGDLVSEITIQDGSNLKPEDIALFGKLSDLEKLQIFNYRMLNEEMVTSLSGLKGLKSLALTNSAINDAAVEIIAKSFPDLIELDLSSNTNMTNGVVKIISALGKLQRLNLLQNQINDIGAQRLAKLQDLRSLDLRGNMEAGNMALDVVGDLPKLTAFKHRSTAVDDTGMEALSRNQTVESLLLQDFVITDQSGPHLAKLGKLSQLEVFRCQGFGSEGVLALKGMGLTRLTLRDLPNVDDRAMEVFTDLPKLKRLYLHELPSVSDAGLKNLSALSSLELLDIWTIPQMKDETVNVIASLPNLKELSIRATSVTDNCIEALLKIPSLQSLTFKENGSVTAEGLKKLSSKKWQKLDIGSTDSAEASEAAAP